MQLHRGGDTVQYFSRNGNEHGEMSHYTVLDDVVKRQLRQDRVILDGEVVVWNKTRRAEPLHGRRVVSNRQGTTSFWSPMWLSGPLGTDDSTSFTLSVCTKAA